MPTKLQMLSELAENTTKQITNSFANWAGFLTTVGRLYKYPYYEQLVISAQRPDAFYNIARNMSKEYYNNNKRDISYLIENSFLEEYDGDNSLIKKDLKMVFPIRPPI